MGADIIQAEYDELEAIAGRFGNQAEANADLHRRTARCVQVLQQGGWEGEGATAFFAEMEEEVFPAMQRLTHALEEAGTVTLRVRDIIRQAEEEAASVFDRHQDDGGMSPKQRGTDEPSLSESPRPDLGDEFQEFRAHRQPYTAEYVGYPRSGPARSLAQLLGLFRQDITDKEADLLDQLNPFQLSEANSIHDEAFATETQYFGGAGNNDGIADAFRHAYWSARLTQAFGGEWATEFTDAHESKPGNPTARDFMDRWNNALGIQIAQEHPNESPQKLANLIAEAINNGEGAYIPSADQYGLNTPERSYLAENGPLAYTNERLNAPGIELQPVDEQKGISISGN